MPCLALTRSFAQNPVNLNNYVFKAGDVLEYELNKQGKTYRLIITLTGKTFIDSKIIDAITFNWERKGDTITKGNITITKEARVNASVYLENLSSGSLTLNNKSCLWLSLKSFQSLLSPDGAKLDIGDGKKILYKIVSGTGDKYTFSFKGKPGYMSAFEVKATSSRDHFSFSPTTNSNALLLSVDMGWTMKLKEIR